MSLKKLKHDNFFAIIIIIIVIFILTYLWISFGGTQLLKQHILPKLVIPELISHFSIILSYCTNCKKVKHFCLLQPG